MEKLKNDGGNVMSKVLPGHETFTFLKGWNQVSIKDAVEVRTRIMNELNLKWRVSWNNRLYGVVEPKISEHDAIEKIFADYGITDVWGV